MPEAQNKRKLYLCIIIALLLMVVSYVGYRLLLQDSNSVRVTTDPASTKWAQSVANFPVENFYKVSDTLYRGAQPDREGVKALKKLGIKTIVNLRELHSDRDEISATGLKYFHIRSSAFNMKLDEVEEFLDIMADSKNHPVFVHCQHGSDRTGTMCAFYRMVFQDWTKDAAIAEMTKGGFGFHKIWRNELLPFINKTDVDLLQKKYVTRSSGNE